MNVLSCGATIKSLGIVVRGVVILMADFKTIGIWGWYDLGETIKPTVMEVKYFDSGSVDTSPINTTNNFQIQLRFSKAMNKTITPTVWMDSNGTLDPVVPSGAGTWYDIIESGDTWRTPNIKLSGDHVGTVTVKASGATADDGNVMDVNNAVDTFTLQKSKSYPTAVKCLFRDRVRYTKTSGQSLEIEATDAIQMWISGDIVNEAFRGTTPNAWITYSTSGDVNINAGDGQKRIWAKFNDASGNETAFTGDAVYIDRSGDNIGWIDCTNGSGGATIPQSTWQLKKEPYFFWSAPSGSVSFMRGYSFVLTSGGGTEVPDSFLDSVKPYYDYKDNPIKSGKWKFIVKAMDDAGNFGNTITHNIWVASGDTFDTGRIRAWTSGDKVTEIPNGAVTWSGDASVYLEWQDPSSPEDDTFYINWSGDTVTAINYAAKTTNANYTTPVLGQGIWRIRIRSITGLGVSGDVSEFLFVWASGSAL